MYDFFNPLKKSLGPSLPQSIFWSLKHNDELFYSCFSLIFIYHNLYLATVNLNSLDPKSADFTIILENMAEGGVTSPDENLENYHQFLVIGGGISGLSAASHLAKNGFKGRFDFEIFYCPRFHLSWQT